MGISIKLAPGVRVRASSRGIRASVGPRAARIHVGSGRTGFSTGVGPVGYYTSLGGSSRRSDGSARRSSTGAVSRSLAGQEKLAQADAAAEQIRQILALHTEQFDTVTAPVAPMPTVASLEEIQRQRRAELLRGVGLLQRRQRAQVKQTADTEAQQEHARQQASARSAQVAAQAELDVAWQLLLDNHPDAVLEVLDGAFEDNDAAAAPLGIEGSTVQVAVLVPGQEAVPEKVPGVTAAGNPSLRKMTKKQSAALYSEMVAGYGLVTAKEAFAVAPGLTNVAVMALRRGPVDAYGSVSGEVMMAFTLSCTALDGIQWQEAAALQVLEDACSSLTIRQKGAAQELQPLTAADVENLETVLAAFDLDT